MSTNATIKHLRYFIAVANGRSFASASVRCNTVPSSVKRLVQQLEETVGLRLFDRTSRGVTLTASGVEFLPVAERLVRDFDDALGNMRAIAGGERGRVTIVTAQSFAVHVLAPAISLFTRRYPKISFTIQIGESGEAQQRILSGEFDIGFVAQAGADPQLSFRPIIRDRLNFLCRPGHPLLDTPGAISWSSLADYPYVAFTVDTGPRAALQNASLRSEFFREPIHEVSAAHMLPPLLGRTNSYSLVPVMTAALPWLRNLSSRPMNEPVPERVVCIVKRRGRELSRAAELFLRYVEEQRRSAILPEGARI